MSTEAPSTVPDLMARIDRYAARYADPGVDPEREDLDREDLEEALLAAGVPDGRSRPSSPEYVRAEHVAQIRVANAGRGMVETARLMKQGSLSALSLDAARAELEAARDALGAIHATPVGGQPPVTVRLSAEEATALRGLVIRLCGGGCPCGAVKGAW